MSDLISRQMAIDSLTEIIMNLKNVSGDMGSAVNGARECIKSLPSIEPERTAKVKVRYCVGYCECGQAVNTYSTYCHKCGAKLDWSGNEL